MKVLIVDDSSFNRNVLMAKFSQHGHEAVAAADGLEGLEKAACARPDLIVSDILMPKLDGFQFLYRLKCNPATRWIPFVFYSVTYNGNRERELAKKLGADGFVERGKTVEDFWDQLCPMLDLPVSGNRAGVQEELIAEDTEFLREYVQIVNAKLESKIEQLVAAQAELKFMGRRFEHLMSQSPTAVYSAEPDPPYAITFITANIKDLCGHSVSDFMGESAFRMAQVHPDDRQCFLEQLAALPATGHQLVEYRLRCSSGEYLWVLDEMKLTNNEAGYPAEIVASLMDINERKLAEIALQKAEEQLRHTQKMEAIGTLVGGIAHDFNNMLNVIVGYGSLIEMKMAADNPFLPQIREMLAASEKAAQLTKGLLLFCRKQVLELKSVNLYNLVSGFEKILRRIIGEDIALQVTVPAVDEAGMFINADAGQIEQVLMNLAVNARDAMPAGGSLDITLQAMTMDEQFITDYGYGKPGRYICIEVSDTGCGMDANVMERKYEPYYTTKPMGRGTGMGLSIVYGIVKQHDGYIGCDSEPGKGSTFRVYLPLAEGKTETLEKLSGVEMHGAGETILLAEDNDEVREFMKLTLEDYGYRVIAAADGAEAVDLFKLNNQNVRLVLLDVVMPVKSGRQACEEICQIRSNMPVIFISGYVPELLKNKLQQGSTIEFIPKPVTPQTLLQKVRVMLDRNG